MNPECPHQCEVPHLLSGEAVSPEAARHLRECAVCSREAESLRRIMERLRSAPAAPSLPDLAPRILQQIRGAKIQRARVHRIWWQTGAAAALVAVLATAAWQFGKPENPTAPGVVSIPSADTPAKDTNVAAGITTATTSANTPELRASFERAMDWLCQNQEGDGSWDAARWEGQNRFRVSLTALCALALMSADSDSPHRTEPAARAVAWLMRQQRADGCFGASPSLEPYDHSLSLLAVLRAEERGLAQPETLPLSAALEQLIHQPVPARFRADPLLARWNHSAVQIAAGMNLPGASAALPHFAAAANSADKETAPSSVPGGAIDFSSAFYLAGSAADENDAPGRVTELLSSLSMLQSREGAASGSWPPDSRWGKAGGRVHSTALAALSISSAGLRAE